MAFIDSRADIGVWYIKQHPTREEFDRRRIMMVV
jgi:hypothetical protein